MTSSALAAAEARELAATRYEQEAAELAVRGDDVRAETKRRAARIERELAEHARARHTTA
jgi:hypothetical protein